MRRFLIQCCSLFFLGLLLLGCADSGGRNQPTSNTNAKLDKSALPAPDANTALSSPAAPVATSPEKMTAAAGSALRDAPSSNAHEGRGPDMSGDRFAHLTDNRFLLVNDAPLSTFSIDVDTASYAKTRQFLKESGQLPPPDAVRLEEFVNYFDYQYAPPTDQHPFAVHLAAATCPWNTAHQLVRIGLKGKEIDRQERPVSNLVFLVDVSGSMNYPNKLPLLKQGLEMLVSQLGASDRVAIAVYAGNAGLVLPSTSCQDRATVVDALHRLSAGGSTNGGAGIHLAYNVAREHFVKGGVNRVILCTDGDFNVGVTSPGDLVRLAEENAKSDIFLSILGFGMGNHNDALLKQLSVKANGNYAFIDTEREAKKVLVDQLSGTLTAIAKDVKIQVEFNPTRVASYRLIGYENRLLADRDFNDDQKDAGDIGAGHTVTALYEIVPTNALAVNNATGKKEVDDLKYQQPRDVSPAAASGELLTVKLRYKPIDSDTSTLLAVPLAQPATAFANAPADMQFASAVALFGMLLRNSEHRGDATWAAATEIAASLPSPEHLVPQRTEFLELVQIAQRLATTTLQSANRVEVR